MHLCGLTGYRTRLANQVTVNVTVACKQKKVERRKEKEEQRKKGQEKGTRVGGDCEEKG